MRTIGFGAPGLLAAVLDDIDGVTGIVDETLPLRAEVCATPMAEKYLEAEPFLQSLNATGDRGLGHKQFIRRAPETAETRHL